MIINSIYETISGEYGGFPQGTWITLLRLQGCNLASPDGRGGCAWCDTPDAKAKRPPAQLFPTPSPEDAFGRIIEFGNKHVLITGGEPLLQKQATVNLARRLLQAGYEVQIETNGSISLPIEPDLAEVYWVVDHKCPSSGVSHRMRPLAEFCRWSELSEQLSDKCRVCIKWVVADLDDLNFALDKIRTMIEDWGCPAVHAISPVDARGCDIPVVAEYIRQQCPQLLDRIIFSVQIHKLIKMS